MESGNESDGEGSRDYDFEEEPARDVVSDEDVLSEADAERMDEAFIRSLMIGNTSVTSQEKKQREDALRATQWTPVVSSDFEVDTPEYPGLGEHMALPVAELRAVASSPLQTFLYFMPKSLWVMIADETNRYSLQQLDQRAKGIQTKQHRRRRESLKQIRRRLKLKHEYKPHEILNVIGLLVARMLCPQKRRFSDHWSMVEDGAIPAGNFGRFMGRNRCQDILRDLHFVDNEAPRTRDKLWKLRPIIDKLQQRFLEGWSLPAVISFDEGVLPSTSRRNTTRMFMPDKPHRYGSKMFMTCDSRTSYCHRFELYAGKRQAGTAGDAAFDHKTGAAAVVRNLKVLFAAKARYQWHTVVVDRYYSSVLLAIELLSMGVAS
uniref:PiggyBac transposable element-derived protein domain-containing protein n=1 Tax=Phytophthora ramorum TaxID=164328 RepID=H3H786_PHYRM